MNKNEEKVPRESELVRALTESTIFDRPSVSTVWKPTKETCRYELPLSDKTSEHGTYQSQGSVYVNRSAGRIPAEAKKLEPTNRVDPPSSEIS